MTRVQHYRRHVDHCGLCDGRAFTIHPITLANVPCWGCGGQATAGVFVVRVARQSRRWGPVEIELTWQTDRLPVALNGTAEMVARMARRGRVGEVRVYYLPATGAVAELVTAVPVVGVPPVTAA